MLNARKKIGIGLVLTGAALLLLAFLAIPLAWGGVAVPDVERGPARRARRGPA